jgi:lysophospholipase L1-like esterase
MLGINDAGNATTTATWSANMTSIITEAQKTGDAIIMSVVPSDPGNAARLALEDQYRGQAKTVAAAMDVPFVDIFGKIGAYTPALYSDILHPNARGYANIARYVYDALQALQTPSW